MTKLELKVAAIDAGMYGLEKKHKAYQRLYPRIATDEARDDAEYVMLEIVTRIDVLRTRKQRALIESAEVIA